MKKLLLHDNRLINLVADNTTGLFCGEPGGCRAGEIVVRQNRVTGAFFFGCSRFRSRTNPCKWSKAIDDGDIIEFEEEPRDRQTRTVCLEYCPSCGLPSVISRQFIGYARQRRLRRFYVGDMPADSSESRR